MIITSSVKTRIQLDPVTYNKGLIGGFRQVIQHEGYGALATGFGPTAAGYFLQGAFKFGGYELFKQQCINYLGYETASNNRTSVYLASSALAEFFADIALCPLEATRIRLVSQPAFATGLLSGFGKIYSQEGIGAFYSGFGPILFKQYVPKIALIGTFANVQKGCPTQWPSSWSTKRLQKLFIDASTSLKHLMACKLSLTLDLVLWLDLQQLLFHNPRILCSARSTKLKDYPEKARQAV